MKIYVLAVPFLSQYIGVAISQSGRILRVSERPGRLEQVKFFMGCEGSTRLHDYYRRACLTDHIEIELVMQLPPQVIANFESRERAYFESHGSNHLPGGVKVQEAKGESSQ